MHKSTDDKPKPKLYSGHNPQPTDPSSSAFVQPDEWVIPLRENEDGTVVPAPDYEPARTEVPAA